MIQLKGYEVVLASKSPRRAELLKGLDIDFKVEVREVDESYPSDIETEKVAEYIAGLKAAAFEDLSSKQLVIFSDTVVVVNNKVLGKPKSREEAFEMIQLLSNNVHHVYSAVYIKTEDKEVSFTDVAEVHFNSISLEEMEYYVDHKKPFDKAGAYGIQEWIGMAFIKKINGSYFTVMGLPTEKLYSTLKEII
ncbi:Maf family nucleotide pyrophosphatase [Flammeovirga sp. SubArs3]|uniref:Maf family nucleotide pyrophosphatase n=1 Tax=Flammeovirga sp. SubArs3 TaxID=2995316 RepID=UPI00248C44F0|nr:Maf family nucleotide pyrophosphatase [Flammeovirga sp. SubArs3]